MAEKRRVAKIEKINTKGETQKAMDTGKDHVKRQVPAGAEEKAMRESTNQTRGRKGCRSPRISLYTNSENYQFVKVMARLTGRPMSGYIDFIIEQYRKEHPGLYEKALDVMKEAGIDVLEDEDTEDEEE